MQVKQVPEEEQYSCVGCVYRPAAGRGCAHPEGEQGLECNRTHSIYKAATKCSVTKHKEEYRAKITPLNEAVYRANDPDTSKGKRKVNKYEQAVLDILTCEPHGPRNRGLTGKEIALYTGHPLNCITPRFAPLRRKGLIKAAARFNHYDVLTGEATVVLKRDKQIVWVLA